MCPDKVTEDEEDFLTKCKSYDHLKIKHQITTSSAVDINTANQGHFKWYDFSSYFSIFCFYINHIGYTVNSMVVLGDEIYKQMA